MAHNFSYRSQGLNQIEDEHNVIIDMRVELTIKSTMLNVYPDKISDQDPVTKWRHEMRMMVCRCDRLLIKRANSNIYCN